MRRDHESKAEAGFHVDQTKRTMLFYLTSVHSGLTDRSIQSS